MVNLLCAVFTKIANSVTKFLPVTILINMLKLYPLVRQNFPKYVAAPKTRQASTQNPDLTPHSCTNEISWKRFQSAVGPHQLRL